MESKGVYRTLSAFSDDFQFFTDDKQPVTNMPSRSLISLFVTMTN